MDEIGLRVVGERLWLHVIGDGTVTAYRLGARSNVWKGYSCTAVHDILASYRRHLSDETDHSLYNAHRLRNLEAIIELEKEPDGRAAHMQLPLLEARDIAAHRYEAAGGPVPAPVRADTAAVWDACLESALAPYESLPPPARGHLRGHNLTRTLWTLRDVSLLFMADPAVPFTNSLAERVLRMAKLQLRIASCFRTRAGAERFAPMRGLVETTRQREWHLLDLLRLGPGTAGAQPHPVPP